MKSYYTLFSLSAIGILALSSCQSNKSGSGAANVVNAESLADIGAMPPWMIEEGDKDLAQYQAANVTQSEPSVAKPDPAPSVVKTTPTSTYTPSVDSNNSTSGRSATSSKKSSSFTYEVRKGETLTSIAKKFGTSSAAIKSASGLKSTKVYRGQDLRIPRRTELASNAGSSKSSTSSSSGRSSFTYVVGRGDSMAEIAGRYDTTTTAIRRANGLSSTKVKRGQELKIPRSSSGSSSSKVASTSSSKKSNSNVLYYTVKRGETLASIAKKYGSTTTAIKNASGLKGNTVKRGQSISIPK